MDETSLFFACIIVGLIGVFGTIVFNISSIHASERACVEAGLGFEWATVPGVSSAHLRCIKG